ncbi:MAG: hypothetical protein ACK6CP_23470 [Pseudanabaena sp.]|jgi:hypothetical protein|nr:hypothetical protein [Pseudanabaena sp. M090S1SP2A07QC]MCA6505788.1 hypothetical protein [Pseudanabaena sp. M172S2SP2A07QC]MCA6521868.1 hypothetical protein [Pseudanabaena sp. M051S1SP2A07QC]MCA6524551.1 hypothetical protein [Pseudanabaena sp. M179S2SP2A07QC]MCA6528515.1 hypothetical protein [Pseudanabaena sp. M125S2SP2A07QC]MCA6534492.1 hypothetical protein [Pseudanabaena sp. M176S2SP2A07QC]MCA6538876.1 hypothetical protein [Pseudanabaena sp. M037S2SP2A07QC]MCA6544946.1 hypothetical prot
MIIRENALYILIEGKPYSPEVSFFKQLSFPDDIVPLEFVEVGGSGSFNIVSELIYNKIQDRKKSIHHKIPVLAITDNDFRKYPKTDDKSDSTFNDLIQEKKPQKIYLERHEWENFLLDELDIITDILNSSQINKIRQDMVQKDYIEKFLLQYFQNEIQIQTEFIQCIRFRFGDLRKKYPRLEDPKYKEIQDIKHLKQWYESELTKQAQFSKDEIESEKYLDIFDDVLDEYNWKNWLEDPKSLLFEDGKKYFQGKEAFKALLDHLVQKFKISPSFLNEREFKPLIIEEIQKNRDKSVLVDQIDTLLRPYLKMIREGL